MSSAEQSSISHSFAKVASEGWALPEQYCETVGLDTPKRLAISLLLNPEFSISRLIFRVIASSKFFSIR